jgi:hypothetical protein
VHSPASAPDFSIFFALPTVLLVVGHLFNAHYVVKLSTMLLPPSGGAIRRTNSATRLR